MSQAELSFCENYESKLKELELLLVLNNVLTEKGKQVFNSTKQYLDSNLDKYLELTR